MVLVDFTKEDLDNILEVFDHDNFLDYDDDNTLHKLREKISKYSKQKNFVYVGDSLLNEEDSIKFLEELKRPATQEELDFAKEADEVFRNTKLYKNGYCYKCETEKSSTYFRDVCEECF